MGEKEKKDVAEEAKPVASERPTEVSRQASDTMLGVVKEGRSPDHLLDSASGSNVPENFKALHKQMGDAARAVRETVEPGSTADQCLKAGKPSAERSKLLSQLIKEASSDDPEQSNQAIKDLKTIHFVESAGTVLNTLDSKHPEDERDRRAALLQLYEQSRSEGSAGGPASECLNLLSENATPGLTGEMSVAKNHSELQHESLEEETTRLLQDILRGNPEESSSALGLLKQYSRSQLDSGNGELLDVVRLAGGLNTDRSGNHENRSLVDRLNDLRHEGVPVAASFLARWEEKGLLKLDVATDLYRPTDAHAPALIAKDIWLARNDSGTSDDSRSKYILELDEMPDSSLLDSRQDLAHSEPTLESVLADQGVKFEKKDGQLVGALKDGGKVVLDEQGRISEIVDRNGCIIRPEYENGELAGQEVRFPNGTVHHLDNSEPPRLTGVSNPDGSYARFDTEGRVVEMRGNDKITRTFKYEGDQLVSFTDGSQQYDLKQDDTGNSYYQHSIYERLKIDGTVSVKAALDAKTGEVKTEFETHDAKSGEKTTVRTDGTTEVVTDAGACRKYDAHGKLESVTNQNTGESYSFKHYPPGHRLAGELKEVTTPDNTTWARGKSDQEWIPNNGGKPWHGKVDVNEQTGAYHYKSADGSEKFWHPERKTEFLSAVELKRTTDALYQCLNGRGGPDVDRFEALVEGKTEKQRDRIKEYYKELTNRDIFSDINTRFSPTFTEWGGHSRSDKLRCVNAINKKGDETADYAGALTTAFTKYGETLVSGANPAKEIRSILMGRSAQEIEQIRDEFPKRLKAAGLDPVTLDDAVKVLSEPYKSTTEILLKGADKLNYNDFSKLSEISLDNKDLAMFLETWSAAPENARARYLEEGGEQRVKDAFPWTWGEVGAKKGYELDQGKALDMLKMGFVGADKFIREASAYLYGDTETHIDSAMRNMPEQEREMFKLGAEISKGNPEGNDLSGKEKEAFERYKSIMDALKVAGYPYEVNRWEEIGLRGGGLITDLAGHKGMLGWDSSTHDVMSTIENMSRDDFERLRLDPDYSDKVKEVIKAFADGSETDPNSEVSRCLELLDRKMRIESDTGRMSDDQKALYEKGREVFESGWSPDRLTKEDKQALEAYGKLGPNLDMEKLSSKEELAQYERGRELSEMIAASDFYRERTFRSSQVRAARSIFEVINDNERWYSNHTGNLLDALKNMRPDELAMYRRGQQVASGEVKLSDLSGDERKQFEAGVQFKDKLDQRLDQVLDRGAKAMSTLSSTYDWYAHTHTSERDAAKLILDKAIGNKTGDSNILVKLNEMAGHLSVDRAEVTRSVLEAFREKPWLKERINNPPDLETLRQQYAAGKLQPPELAKMLRDADKNGKLEEALKTAATDMQTFANDFRGSLRKSLGHYSYEQKLLNGQFSEVDQLSLRLSGSTRIFSDKEGLLKDIQAMSPEQRERLSAMLKPERLSELMAGKTTDERAQLREQAEQFKSLFNGLAAHEQAIVRNALKNGMQPEDWLRYYSGQAFDGTDEAGIERTLSQLTDREQARNDLAAKLGVQPNEVTDKAISEEINRKLDLLTRNFAAKYGEDLKDALQNELGGQDLLKSLRAARHQALSADDAVFLDQREFFKNYGMGAAFVDSIGWGASTSLMLKQFDQIVSAQASERRGEGAYEVGQAREDALNLFEASLEASQSQTQLSDLTVDIAIAAASIAATIPSGGSSLLAWAGSIASKCPRVARAMELAGSTISKLDDIARISSAVERTKALTQWFSQASRAEQMIAMGLVGGTGKVGFKSQFAGHYDINSQGFQDFVSGFTDMALNADIPLGKLSRAAAAGAEKEMTLGFKIMEAAYASRQGLYAGALSSLAYWNPDARIDQNLLNVAISGAGGGIMNLGFAAPLAAGEHFLGRWMSKAKPDAPIPAGGAHSADGLHTRTYGHAVKEGGPSPDAPGSSGHKSADSASPGEPSDVAAAGRTGFDKAAHGTDEKMVHNALDKSAHDLAADMKHLEKNRSKMSAAEIDSAERAIAEKKAELMQAIKADGESLLVEKYGLKAEEAKAVMEKMNISFANYDHELGIRGAARLDGSLTLMIGADLPAGASITQTFNHELRHLVNHSRNYVLLQSNPRDVLTTVVDDSVSGALSGGKRIEPYPGATDAADCVRTRLSAEGPPKLSDDEVRFVQAQLKDYLMYAGQGGKIGPEINEEGLAAWLKSRQAEFPDPAHSALLLKEMVGEIKHANFVMEDCVLLPSALDNPGIKQLVAALDAGLPAERRAAKIEHHFAGVSNSAVGVGDSAAYKVSAEEFSARRAPAYQQYQEAGREVRRQIEGLSLKKLDNGRMSPESIETARQLKQIVDGMEKDGRKLTTEEHKAFVAAERKLFDLLGSEKGQRLLHELKFSNKDAAHSIVNAITVRESTVANLRYFSAHHRLSNAAREYEAAMLAGTDTAGLRGKLDKEISNLIAKTPPGKIGESLSYLMDNNLATPDLIMKLTPGDQLDAIRRSLKEHGHLSTPEMLDEDLAQLADEISGDGELSSAKKVDDAPASAGDLHVKQEKTEVRSSPDITREVEAAASEHQAIRLMRELAEIDNKLPEDTSKLALPGMLADEKVMKEVVDEFMAFKNRWKDNPPKDDNDPAWERLGEDFQKTLNNILEKQNLPPVTLSALSDKSQALMGYAFGKGNLKIKNELGNFIINPKDVSQIPAVLHELTHVEHDTLILRNLRDQLASENNLTDASLKALYEEKFPALKLDPDMVDFILRKDKHPPLTPAERARAEAIEKSVGELLDSQSKKKEVGAFFLEARKSFDPGTREYEEAVTKAFIEKANSPGWLQKIVGNPHVPDKIFELTALARTDPSQLNKAELVAGLRKWEKSVNNSDDHIYSYSLHEREGNEVRFAAQSLIDSMNKQANKFDHRQAELTRELVDREFIADVFEHCAKQLEKKDFDALPEAEKAKVLQDILKNALIAQYRSRDHIIPPIEVTSLKVEMGQAASEQFGKRAGSSLNAQGKPVTETFFQIPSGKLDSKESAMYWLSQIYTDITAERMRAWGPAGPGMSLRTDLKFIVEATAAVKAEPLR